MFNTELVQIVSISRHCDRTPYYKDIIPNSPVDWKKELGYDYETLTGIGQQQCFKVGEKLRERYVNENSELIFNVPKKYNSMEYSFTSTDTNRTQRTCFSIAQGLFPLGSGDKLDDKKYNETENHCALPQCMQNVPVRSRKPRNDYILTGYDSCISYYTKTLPSLYKSQKWKDLEAQNQENMESILKKLGFWEGGKYRKLEDWGAIFDMVHCQVSHDLFDFAKTGITQDDLDFITFIHDMIRSNQFSGDVMGAKGASPLFMYVFDELFKETIAKYNHSSTTQEFIRFNQFCAHDLTLMSIFAGLGLMDEYEELKVNPGYGATFIFELHYSEIDKKFYLKFVYLPSFEDEFKAYEIRKDGLTCELEKCEFDYYLETIYPRTIIRNWCSLCENFEADLCLEIVLQAKNMENVFLWCIIGILSFTILTLVIGICSMMYRNYKRQKNYEENEDYNPVFD